MIRLYGRTVGINDSWARVSYGLKGALEELGVLAGFCPVYDDVADIDEGLGVGYDAAVGVYVGPPAHSSIMVGRGEHPVRLTMIAANSTWLPEATMRTIDKTSTGLIGPSVWSHDVLRTSMGHPTTLAAAMHRQGTTPAVTTPKLPVYVWRHGVSAAFRSPESYLPYGDDGVFRALHFSSTSKERKGTRELIHAWCYAYHAGKLGPKWFGRTADGRGCLRRGANLRLVVDGRERWKPEVDAAVSALGDRNVFDLITVVERRNLSEVETAKLYTEHHVVIQPSRAEGFGLVPLEAAACGVPTLLTKATGHADFFDYVAMSEVPVRELAPIDDGPGALAPSVELFELAQAIGDLHASWELCAAGARAQAPALGASWSWRSATEQFLSSYALLGNRSVSS